MKVVCGPEARISVPEVEWVRVHPWDQGYNQGVEGAVHIPSVRARARVWIRVWRYYEHLVSGVGAVVP